MWGFVAMFGVYALVRAGAALCALLVRRVRAGKAPRDKRGN